MTGTDFSLSGENKALSCAFQDALTSSSILACAALNWRKKFVHSAGGNRRLEQQFRVQPWRILQQPLAVLLRRPGHREYPLGLLQMRHVEHPAVERDRSRTA